MKEFLDVSGAVQAWATNEQVTLGGDPMALHDLAKTVRVKKLPEDSRLLLIGYKEVPHYKGYADASTIPQRYLPTVERESDLVVRWGAVPGATPGEHEASLTTAVAERLNDIKHAERKREAKMWGGLTFLGGIAMVGIGEFVAHNDVAPSIGWGVAILGLAYAAIRNQRPSLPHLKNAAPPIRVRQRV